ncbi:amidohydrolase [Streptomyces sp. NRRL F-5122]|uniref:amidohydrolase family protein n=1 Tax=unclassified Streptomyces TaxID=2593676 RepID=UPI000740E450|nr:amidohydrolase family protein [Streptomyces sp. NRRL F-5122]KUJ42249.1 amidohydrolase [Streptomyces sp. NRRL F-5122]
MSRVDAHHHVWRPASAPPSATGSGPRRRVHEWLDAPGMAPLRRDFTLADLAPAARAAGIDRTVLVQVLPDIDETAEFLMLAAAGDVVAGVVGWADLTSDDLAGTLDALRAAPGGDHLVGLRHLVQGEPDPGWLNRPDVRRGLRTVAQAGLTYDLLVLPHQLPAAITAVRERPELTFVLDHLSKPPIATGELQPWASLVRELAALPNVFCKLSGMVTEAERHQWSVDALRPYADVVLDAFGPERVMFGSDWPVCLLAASYEQVVDAAEALTADLTAAERSHVFAVTAERAYGLGERDGRGRAGDGGPVGVVR